MTIILPESYNAQEAILKRNISCITTEQAAREDIRALRIGIINLADFSESYEACLLDPLGRSVMQIEPVWIRLKTYPYPEKDKEHITGLYKTFEDAVEKDPVDGLIISGNSCRKGSVENQDYWQELCRIFKYARNNITSTIGISWGAQAVAVYLGLTVEKSPTAVSGIYPVLNLAETNPLTSVMDDVFPCPVCKNSGITAASLEESQKKGEIVLLARSETAGYILAETADRRFLMHFGHPEMEPELMLTMCNSCGASNTGFFEKPAGEQLLNTWRGHRSVLFSQWIKYIHETGTY